MRQFITADRIVAVSLTVISTLVLVVLGGIFVAAVEWLFGPIEGLPDGVLLAFSTTAFAGLALVLLWWGATR